MKEQPVPFLFMHIPKTGGITFHSILRNQYKDVKRYTMTIKKDVLRWNSLGKEEKDQFNVVKGHFWWQGTQFHPRGGIYFTFLREPVNRFISHYHHVHYHKQGKASKVFGKKDFSIKELIESGQFLNFDNCMVRYLSGTLGKEWDTINEDDLKLAISNFDEHFQHFGIVERYDESLLLLQKELGWASPYYVRLNERRTGKSGQTHLDNESTKLIEHFTRYDKLLWEHGKRKFEEKIAKYDGNLKNDLDKFQKANNKNILFRKLYHIIFGTRTFR